MNRGKFWLYMALTLVAGIANLFVVSRALTHRALDALDREQRSAATQVDARAQLLAADAERLAEAVARDPATIQTLSPDAPGVGDAAAASRAAMEAARTMGLEANRPLLVATAGRGGRSASVSGEPTRLQNDDALFAGVGTARREGYVRTERGIWYAVAVPLGRDSAVAVGMPIDATWLAALKSATGSDVTLTVEGRKPLGTLSPRDMAVVEAAARSRPVAPQSAGALGREGPPTGTMPLLFATAPAFRVHVLALKGASGALALSRATAPLLGSLATYQWTMLGALVALALVGVALGLLITNEQAALVPKALTNAADRISRGDFAARAPVMAGSLGTIAAALNRAAEAAEMAVRPAAAWEAPTSQVAVPSSLAEGPTEQLSPAEMAPEQPGTAPLAGQEWAPSREAAPEQEAFAARDAAATAEPVSAVAQEPGPEAAAPAELASATAAVPEERAELAHAPAELPSAAAELAAPPPELAGLPPELAGLPPELAGSPAELAARAELEAGPAEGTFAQAEARGATPFEPTLPPAGDERTAAGELPEAKTDELLAAAAIPPQEALASPPEPEPAAAPPSPEPAAPARVAAPASAVSTADEDHWSSVYQEFIRVRRDCGESAEGVPYPRFRNKLQQNRDHLVAKYGCKTVRFQVYVKQGKAALKASPVR